MLNRRLIQLLFPMVVMALVLGIILPSTPNTTAQTSSTDTFPNGVAAGDTTQTSTVLWVRSTRLGPIVFEYGTSEGFESGTVIGDVTTEVTDAMQPIKVELNDLTPDTQYYYRVTAADGNSIVGRFRTAADVGTFTGLRFGVSGDWRGELAPYPAIANAAARDLEFFVALGDTIYADYPSPALESPQAVTLEDFMIKHDESYSARFGINYWADLRGSTSYIPSIDDHEVTNDFAGGAPPASDLRFANQEGEFINETTLFNNGIQAFVAFNPIRDETWGATNDPRTANKVNLYRYFTYGSDAAVYVLDNRSFRDQPLVDITDFGDLQAAIAFFRASYDDSRTMLGQAQRDALLNDLQAAQAADITWKFVMMPEPIQNMGLALASDRYEGYAAERNIILEFITNNNITNVVFIAADIHGTLVNDITYQPRPIPFSQQIATNTWEISTGSVAFYEPFGPTVVQLADQLGLLDADTMATYTNATTFVEQEAFMEGLLNAQVTPLGYTPIGLDNQAEGNTIDAILVEGAWTATHTFGWTEFEIDAETQELTVTTYGIEPYSRAEIFADPDAILAREPEVLQIITVRPVR